MPSLVPFLGRNLLALGFMAFMVLASLAIGWLLAGPDPQERTTVSLVTSMRNPGLALLFAQLHAPIDPLRALAQTGGRGHLSRRPGWIQNTA